MTLKVLVGIIVAAILGILTNVVSGYINPTPGRRNLYFALFISVLALSLAVVFMPDSNPFLPKAEVKIIQPREGDEILMKTSVIGTFKNLPIESRLWIYVFAPKDGESNKGKYYLNEIIDRYSDGKWDFKDFILGSEKDDGESYRLGVLMPDEKMHKQLKQFSQGLDEIPEGEKFSEILVRRRSKPSQAVQPPKPTPSVNAPTPSTPILDSSPPVSTLSATIDEPADGESVDRNARATGTLQDLNAGDSLWIYIYPSVQKLYYPAKVMYDPKNKTWEIPLVVGSVEKEESGASYELGLFTADSELGRDLVKWGENGTSKLPDGIKKLKTITIKRK